MTMTVVTVQMNHVIVHLLNVHLTNLDVTTWDVFPRDSNVTVEMTVLTEVTKDSVQVQPIRVPINVHRVSSAVLTEIALSLKMFAIQEQTVRIEVMK